MYHSIAPDCREFDKAFGEGLDPFPTERTSGEQMTRIEPIVFIVDDDESVRRSLSRLMRSVGYQVEDFSSAEDFLQYPRREEGDCVILDIRMPGMSGLELQRELAVRGSELPVIFVTAHEDEATRGQAVEAGAVAVIGKPADDHLLLDAIDRARRPDRIEERESDGE